MKIIKTFILCHTQEFVINSIQDDKYRDFGDYYFVFMGMGQTDKIDGINNVIICRNLPHNIEEQKNCLQYCGWYGLYHNNLIDTDYFRIIDYDIDIIEINNTTNHKVKSAIGFNYDFYFLEGFGNNLKFIDTINDYVKGDIKKLIYDYSIKFNQNKWFSSIDVLIDKEIFFDFMEWFKPIYEKSKDEYYFGMFFERYLTIFLIIKNIEYSVTENEINHKQLKSHIYY
jgi:hypothetical protein